MVIDSHVHPGFSADATGEMIEFCSEAKKKGIDGICFTTHFEPDPVRGHREIVRCRCGPVRMTDEWVTEYRAAIDECRRRAGDLVVLAGIEVGYDPDCERAIGDFLRQHEFDFVLGALHSLAHVALTSSAELDELRGLFGSWEAAAVVRLYFDQLELLVASRLFDSVAHVDAYRKYLRPLFGPEFDAAVASRLPGFLHKLAVTGTVMEVNTSALRREMSEPYPADFIRRMAHDFGVRMCTVGSDAHRPADTGADVRKMVEQLKREGFGVVHFAGRRPLAD